MKADNLRLHSLTLILEPNPNPDPNHSTLLLPRLITPHHYHQCRMTFVSFPTSVLRGSALVLTIVHKLELPLSMLETVIVCEKQVGLQAGACLVPFSLVRMD